MEELRNYQIAPGIYRVGDHAKTSGIVHNPYLLVDFDEAVLFDPGPGKDFDLVYENIFEIIPPELIKYIVIHYPSPSVISSLPKYFEKGLNPIIVSHSRTFWEVENLCVDFEKYETNKNDNKLVLNSGKTIYFIDTPYLEYHSAIASYNFDYKILFSAGLFSAQTRKWNLFADRVLYRESMKALHEQISPTSDVLKSVLQLISYLDIELIAPNKGSLIQGELVGKFIEALKQIESGIFLNPLKYEITQRGAYIEITNKIIKQLISIYEKQELIDAFADNDHIVLDEKTALISDYKSTGEQLWQSFFKILLAQKGIRWLLSVEKDVDKIVVDYKVEKPEIFTEERKQLLSAEKKNNHLIEQNKQLKTDLETTVNRLTICPITGLYNENSFRDFLQQQLRKSVYEKTNFAIALISIDRLNEIKLAYGGQGDEQIDRILKTTTQILLESTENTANRIFKMYDPVFSYFIADTNESEPLKLIDKQRVVIRKSERFSQEISISAGLVNVAEFETEPQPDKIFNTAWVRVRTARQKGGDYVCSESELEQSANKILIVEPDELNAQILIENLIQRDFTVVSCTDGKQAMEIIEKEDIKLVISELITPKHNALVVRETMLASSKSIAPFIIISHLANEENKLRAIKLKVNHFLKKPYRLTELLELAQLYMKG